MNYLHFDSTHLFFFIKSVPLESTPGLLVGLALTSGICVCERILTSRLEIVSMRLYERRHQNHSKRHKDTASDVPEGSSTMFAPSRKRSSGRTFSQLGKGDSVRGLLLRKMVFYGLVNVLRLGYMLLAMSFHIGIILVIVASLTCTQMCLDLASLSRSEENAWSSGYEQIGSNRVTTEEDSRGDHGHGRYDLDDGTTEREEEDVDLIPLRGHIALSRSHDCV
ncbi:MAG: hypothetical protein J3Q66DRAFT_348430 [Benniella sp.]|nr:MAG: hypothetical protein J3Q66DRAFT_348430 [Benniella sp.]